MNIRTALMMAVLAFSTTPAHAGPIEDITGFDPAIIANLAQDYEDAGSKCQTDYTVAVAEDGSYGSVCSSKATDDDLARTAIQKCEHWSKGKLCGVVVMRNKAVPYTLSPILMTYPTTFDPQQVPFLWAADRDKLVSKYIPKGTHKALAITRNGTYGWVADKTSPEDAETGALENCEKYDKRGRCFLYSVNEEVVFNKDSNIYPDR